VLSFDLKRGYNQKKKYKISIPFYVVLVISDVCAEEIYFASTTAYYFYYYPYVKTSAQS